MRLRSKAPLNQLGFAAIDNSSFFVNNTYVFGSLNTWGWVVLCAGVLQCLTAWGVFVKNQFARWFGVFVIGANMIVQFLIMPAYPLWSLTIILFDLLAMYGLLAHGRKTDELA